MGRFNQYLCSIITCYITMMSGLLVTWPTASLDIFLSSNRTQHRPMQETELALLGCLSSIGGLVSTPFCGYLLDVVGRKYCIIGAAVLQTLGCAMVACSHQVEVILAAVFIAGMGGCVFLAVPIFISEVSQTSIRGTLTSFSIVFFSLGVLLSYVISGVMCYDNTIYVCLMMSVTGVAMLVYVRETPVFLMKKGLEEEAQKSFAFYRNAKEDSKVVLQEMAALRRAFQPDFDEDITEEKALKPVPVNEIEFKELLSIWKFIKKSRSTRRAAIVTLVLMTAALFQGLLVVQVYSEPLFLDAVPKISPAVASGLMAVLTVFFGIVAAYMSDGIGRRPLFICASIATCLSCVALGAQLRSHWAPNWVTALFIYLFSVTYTLGAGTVPYIFCVEVFMPQVKCIMAMLVLEWGWLCQFLILLIFNPLVAVVGLGHVFYIFAAVCLVTAVYSIFYLPETNGLPVDAIQTLFVNKRFERLFNF